MNETKKDDLHNLYTRFEETGQIQKGAIAFPCVTNNSGDKSIHVAVQNEPPKVVVIENLSEDFQVQGLDFSEKSIRRTFIRKVYSILMCQLLVTLSIITLFMYCRPVNVWVRQQNVTLMIYGCATAVGLVLVLLLVCTEMRRRAPMNFIFLGLFTITQSLLLGIITSYLQSSVVLLAFGITAAICLALTLFAFQTKWDFTTIGGGLLATLLVLIIFGAIAIFIPHYRTLRLLYAGAGVLLFSLYIVYDTQLMVGGEHKYSISPEEYIFAALNLYLDIINLFIYILRMTR